MNFILLTHSRETKKASNTGQLVQKNIPNCKTIIWQRTQPDEFLLKLIQSGKTALVYPVDDDSTSAEVTNFENFILIDSTWQEARKIFNRSPYLQLLPRVTLNSDVSSSYHLRRNQVEGGLCTVESVIELLRGGGSSDLVDKLEAEFKFILDRQ